MKRVLFVLTAAVLFASCASGPKLDTTGFNKSAVPEGYELVWADEFDYEGLPDKEKWDYSLGNINGWGNGEIQKYTKDPKNVYVKDGVCTITALHEDLKSDTSWTSARMKTQWKGQWKKGYIEFSAILPGGRGTWPALWMLPVNEKYGSWPRSGEIDVMEMVGFEEDRIHATIHTNAFNHKINTQKTRSGIIPGTTKAFHTYAIDWTDDKIEWFVDGNSFYKVNKPEGATINEWPFVDLPYYIIMNIAIGGSWGGQKGIDPKLKETKMIVDYVRVYQEPEIQ